MEPSTADGIAVSSRIDKMGYAVWLERFLSTFSRRSRLFAICFFVCWLMSMWLGPDLRAQSASSTENVWLPLAGYDSDTGIAAGIMGRSFLYREDYSPYYRSFSARTMATTQGFYSVDLELDHFQTFGTSLRSVITLYAERFRGEPYFGSGNFTTIDPSLWDEGVYEFERRELGLLYEGRFPLGRSSVTSSKNSSATTSETSTKASSANAIPTLLWLLDIRTDDSKAGSATSLFAAQGLDDHAAFAILPGIGFRLDSRNHEILPTRGLFGEIRVQTSIFTKQVNTRIVKGTLRGFYPLLTLPFFGEVILAQQFQIQYATGQVPHWLQPRLGSRDGLRGVYLNRHQDAGSWLYMAELRSWFLEWERADLRVGGQFFWDMGRVFGEAGNLPAASHSISHSAHLLKHLHTSYGFGGVLGVGSENFFLRMDIGFSDETSRVYFGAGYAF